MPTKVKIDFIVPGFSKCGTTTLCALLDLHPRVFIPEIKEPWYFSHPEFETQHEHYDEHYQDAREGQLLASGEDGRKNGRRVGREQNEDRMCGRFFEGFEESVGCSSSKPARFDTVKDPNPSFTLVWPARGLRAVAVDGVLAVLRGRSRARPVHRLTRRPGHAGPITNDPGLRTRT